MLYVVDYDESSDFEKVSELDVIKVWIVDTKDIRAELTKYLHELKKTLGEKAFGGLTYEAICNKYIVTRQDRDGNMQECFMGYTPSSNGEEMSEAADSYLASVIQQWVLTQCVDSKVFGYYQFHIADSVHDLEIHITRIGKEDLKWFDETKKKLVREKAYRRLGGQFFNYSGVIAMPDLVVLTRYYDTESEKIVLPEGITHIGRAALEFCQADEIVIPEGVRSLGYHSLFCCTKLFTLKLPSTLDEIEHDAFSGCQRLEDIYLPHKMGYVSDLSLSGWEGTVHMSKTEYFRHNFDNATKLGALNGVSFEFYEDDEKA